MKETVSRKASEISCLEVDSRNSDAYYLQYDRYTMCGYQT